MAQALVVEGGEHLVTIDFEGAVRVWDIQSQHLLRTMPDTGITGYGLRTAAMFNENILLVGCNDGTLRMWNIHTGERAATVHAHDYGVAWAAPSADRSLILTCGQHDGLRIWSAAALEPAGLAHRAL